MRWWWILAFWTVFALVSALQSWLAVFTHGHSFPLIVVYHLLVILSFGCPRVEWDANQEIYCTICRDIVLLGPKSGAK